MNGVMRIPERMDFGKTFDSTIEFLWHHYQKHLDNAVTGEAPLFDVSHRYACGFPVPAFQRQLVWSIDQKIKFIESLWLGLSPSTYTVHEYDYEAGGKAKRFSGWLIDGQQRLTTIQEYWENGFAVFGLLYSELTDREKRRFRSIKFAHTEPALWDELKIRDLYNRMAFGGVPHKPEERA